MKVLILNYEFPPLGGGGGSFSRDLALELAKDNEVDVLTSHFKGLMKEERIGGVNIFRVPVLGRNSLYYATLASLISFPVPAIIKGLKLCKEKNYDIINTHFAVPTGPAGAVLSRKTGVPNVLSIHGSDIYNPASKTSPHKSSFFTSGVRFSLNNTKRIIANSSYIKECAERLYSPLQKIDVIPLGMPEVKFTPASREELLLHKNKFYVISIGRMTKIKGYEYLLKAIALVDSPEVELLLIGDGTERSNLEKLSQELGIKKKVKFLGWVRDEKKYQYLAASNAYVMSSIHEGFGMVLLEAMQAGVPIISTSTGGQRDIIKDEKNGILIPPEDPEAIAEAIKKIASTPHKAKEMIDYNKNYVRDFYITMSSRKYTELFKESIL